MRSAIPTVSEEAKWPSNTRWPMVKLGEVLTHYNEYIDAPEAKLYPKLSVKLYGKGVVLDSPAHGAALKMKRHQLAKAGQVILSEIWGKKGAIGFVPEAGEGALCTSHFFLFDVNEDRLQRGWLEAIFRSNYLEPKLGSKAFGTTGYAAVRPKDLLAVEIPLPPLSEQQRIVAKIDELAAKIERTRTLREQATEEAQILVESLLMSLFDEAAAAKVHQIALGEVCTFQGGSQPSKLQFAFEPLPGYIRLVQIRDYKSGEFKTYVPRDSVRRFCSADDVMIGRYGPPIFQILRGIDGAYNVALMKASPEENRLSKDFLYYVLKEPRLFQKVEDDSQRTSGQTGLRKELLEGHVTYVPPIPEQGRIVAKLDAIQILVNNLKHMQDETTAELDALMPSILDKAFNGDL